MLHEMVETAAADKQEELSSALLEKAALVEGLQQELHISQADTKGLQVDLYVESQACMGFTFCAANGKGQVLQGVTMPWTRLSATPLWIPANTMSQS